MAEKLTKRSIRHVVEVTNLVSNYWDLLLRCYWMKTLKYNLNSQHLPMVYWELAVFELVGSRLKINFDNLEVKITVNKGQTLYRFNASWRIASILALCGSTTDLTFCLSNCFRSDKRSTSLSKNKNGLQEQKYVCTCEILPRCGRKQTQFQGNFAGKWPNCNEGASGAVKM